MPCISLQPDEVIGRLVNGNFFVGVLFPLLSALLPFVCVCGWALLGLEFRLDAKMKNSFNIPHTSLIVGWKRFARGLNVRCFGYQRIVAELVGSPSYLSGTRYCGSLLVSYQDFSLVTGFRSCLSYSSGLCPL